MTAEESDFAVCGDGGTAADAQFDGLVGVVEDFMANFDAAAVFRALPPLSAAPEPHERRAQHRAALRRVAEALDARVRLRCPAAPSLEAAAELLRRRRDEVAEEVWEFVSEGCFDYETFVEMWEMNKP